MSSLDLRSFWVIAASSVGGGVFFQGAAWGRLEPSSRMHDNQQAWGTEVLQAVPTSSPRPTEARG